MAPDGFVFVLQEEVPAKGKLVVVLGKRIATLDATPQAGEGFSR